LVASGREFPELEALSSPVRDGRAWFHGSTAAFPPPLNLNFGTISTIAARRL
jgi:hypothetical protein